MQIRNSLQIRETQRPDSFQNGVDGARFRIKLLTFDGFILEFKRKMLSVACDCANKNKILIRFEVPVGKASPWEKSEKLVSSTYRWYPHGRGVILIDHIATFGEGSYVVN